MNEECLKGHCKTPGLKLTSSCSYNIIIEFVLLTQLIKNFIYPPEKKSGHELLYQKYYKNY